MQVPCTLNFEGKEKHISIMNWARLTSNDKQTIDSRLRAIISLRREELFTDIRTCDIDKGQFCYNIKMRLRACLHGGGGPQVGEVTRLAVVEKWPAFTCKLTTPGSRGDFT